jgi:hypothetical protein
MSEPLDRCEEFVTRTELYRALQIANASQKTR